MRESNRPVQSILEQTRQFIPLAVGSVAQQFLCLVLQREQGSDLGFHLDTRGGCRGLIHDAVCKAFVFARGELVRGLVQILRELAIASDIPEGDIHSFGWQLSEVLFESEPASLKRPVEGGRAGGLPPLQDGEGETYRLPAPSAQAIRPAHLSTDIVGYPAVERGFLRAQVVRGRVGMTGGE